MLCRLEMTSTTIHDPVVNKTNTSRKVLKHGTIFDKMFDKVYQQKESLDRRNQSTNPNKSSSHSKGKIKGSGFVGTVQYMAPEMILDRFNYTEAVDWWSCGVLIFECLTKKRLFEGSNHAIVTRDIIKCDIVKRLFQHEDLLDAQSMDLLINLLEKDPKKRIGEKEIKEHPFFFMQQNQSSSSSSLQEGKDLSQEIAGNTTLPPPTSYVGKLKYTSATHQPRHRLGGTTAGRDRDPHDHLQNIDSSSFENSTAAAALGASDEMSTPPRTCLTLPSHDFENLSTSFSKYKPHEKPLDKVSDPLRQKRIQDFYSVDNEDPLASSGAGARGTRDHSKGKHHLPQLPENMVEYDDGRCELESFGSDDDHDHEHHEDEKDDEEY
jgi:serine/threonine protein kinase